MRIQLRPEMTKGRGDGADVARRRGEHDDAAEWLIQRLCRRGEPGRGRKVREANAAAQVAACTAVYHARRALWHALSAWEPEEVVKAMRERSDDGDDYSNRKGISELRSAVAGWLAPPPRPSHAEMKAIGIDERGRRAAMRSWLRALENWNGRKFAERAGQTLMFLPDEWPTLSSDNARALTRVWPHVDLVADRDGNATLAASDTSEKATEKRGRELHPAVIKARLDFDKALEEAIDWNGRLVVATATSTFFVGDGMSITLADLLCAGHDGLRRGLMDFDPNTARPSTYLVEWIAQRIRRCLESAGIIHVPTWVRETIAKIRKAGVDPVALAALVPAIEAGNASADEVAEVLGWTAAEAERVGVDHGATPPEVLAGLSKKTGIAVSTIVGALAVAPTRIDSLDARGRVRDDDEGDDRPAIVLVAEEVDGAAEIEAAVQGGELAAALATLATSGTAGAEQAEVLRRLYGLVGPEETLASIAETRLQSTGRRVNRNTVAHLRDAGTAALARLMGAERGGPDGGGAEDGEASGGRVLSDAGDLQAGVLDDGLVQLPERGRKGRGRRRQSGPLAAVAT